MDYRAHCAGVEARRCLARLEARGLGTGRTTAMRAGRQAGITTTTRAGSTTNTESRQHHQKQAALQLLFLIVSSARTTHDAQGSRLIRYLQGRESNREYESLRRYPHFRSGTCENIE